VRDEKNNSNATKIKASSKEKKKNTFVAEEYRGPETKT